MKRLSIISNLLILFFAMLFVGCNEEEGNPPTITAKAFQLGQSAAEQKVIVPVGTDVAFEFEVISEIELKKVEVWIYSGVGVNKSEPMIVTLQEYPSVNIGYEYSYSDTLLALDGDVRYSVYAQDMDDNHTSAEVFLYLDVNRYSVSLTDGMGNGTSRTFLNTQSGRSLLIANTIADPAGVDLGFSYLEGESTAKACLVSFHEYFKTGSYAMVDNDENNKTMLKDASSILSGDIAHIYDAVASVSELSGIFNSAADLGTTMEFDAGYVAPDLLAGDVLAFKTNDGRYGLIQVTAIDDKGGSLSNDQIISFDMMVEKMDDKE